MFHIRLRRGSEQTMREQWQQTRSSARRYAERHGYFWLPCPLCGTPFGGQEWRSGHCLRTGAGGQGICPPCVYEQGISQEWACIAEGHLITPVWEILDETTERSGSRVRKSGTFNMALPPTHLYCSRCFIEFDPLTQAPIGRPLTQYR